MSDLPYFIGDGYHVLLATLLKIKIRGQVWESSALGISLKATGIDARLLDVPLMMFFPWPSIHSIEETEATEGETELLRENGL